MKTLLFTSLLGLALVASRVQASPLFELVGGVGEQAGLNARATGPSAASTYFNPALLPKARPGFQTGVFILNDAIQLSLDGRNAGNDVPLDYRGAVHANGTVFAQPSVPTQWLRQGCQPPECPLALAARPRQTQGSSGNTSAYQSVGLVAPLIGERLVLGMYGLIPLSQFTTAHSFFVDEREQYFSNSLHPELYSDRLKATSLAFGLGSQLSKQLAVGVDFTLSLRNTASAGTFVGNADDLSHTLLLSTNVGVQASVAPHLAVAYTPTESLRFSATVHSVQSFDIVTGFSTFLPNGNKQSAARTAVHDYLPWQFGLGASYDLISDGIATPTDTHELSLVATALLGLWSQYVDRQGERPAGRYAWSNTVNLGAGLRHSYGHLRTFLDGMYVPSPVPLQTGRTNYVDNDRISTSGGVDYDFELARLHFRVGAQGQVHVLVQRYQRKSNNPSDPQNVQDEFPDDAVDSRGRPIASAAGLQTNNPGWPGFGSAGLIWGGGATLALLF